ncbi:hypothetical protein VTO73DRAFT_9212 [Trametes versicolor]
MDLKQPATSAIFGQRGYKPPSWGDGLRLFLHPSSLWGTRAPATSWFLRGLSLKSPFARVRMQLGTNAQWRVPPC